MELLLDIIVATLAVFGGYSALKLIAELWFIPRSFTPFAAVRLDGTEEDALIDALLEEARASWTHKKRILVLLPEDDAELAARVRRLCPCAEITVGSLPNAPETGDDPT